MAQFSFDALALCNVPNRGCDEQSVIVLQRAQTDFDRKFCTIPAQRKQIEPDAHGTHTDVIEERSSMTNMSPPEAFWQKYLDTETDDVLMGIIKHHHGLTICEQNDTRVIYDHSGVRRCIQRFTGQFG
jgi:hypothetical protein